MSENNIQRLRLLASVSLIGLIFLCLFWEAWLAPLRPGGSNLVLKTIPLMFPLFGILRGKRYTYQWSSMMIWIYFSEGVVRGFADVGLSAILAQVEILLSLIFFLSAIFYAKYSRAL